MKANKYQELKDNLIELYNYAKKHYYSTTPLTQKEKELLVKWSHVILKTFNTLTSVYNYDSSMSIELRDMFFGIYTSINHIPRWYQMKHLIADGINKKLDSQEIAIIKYYLDKIGIVELDADPNLDIENLTL